ncbi:MAG TPA: hypothetical protein VKV03_13645 [Candidatus Binataceae bacterium]|nr:hypothetical protein [Candidatus Binataceae bacterium]
MPPKTNQVSSSRWRIGVIATLVLIPVALHAILLLPEIRLPIPSQNDDGMHYLYVQRANEALTNGDNPFDFWVSELGYGFPQFHYYQHLPHLAVVLLHRMLLKQLALLTVFNLVRYLLLIGFPITVFWSMRAMEFSMGGSAAAAAFASLLSGYFARLGFEYESYLWSGYGMYTQLWAMHLIFLWLGCIQRLLVRGIGYLSAIVVTSALVLSHPFYAYMAGATTIAVLIVNVGFSWCALVRCLVRLSIVGAFALMITSYFWLPFFLLRGYFNVAYGGVYSAALSQSTVHVPHAYPPLSMMLGVGVWTVFHSWRVAMVALLILLGITTPFILRTKAAALALAIFALWLVLFFAPLVAPNLVAALPMRAALDFRRFVGGIDLGAILLVGAAGEWLWKQFAGFREPWSAVVPGMIILIVLSPLIRERWIRDVRNTTTMEAIAPRIDAGSDLQRIVEKLKTEPSARVFLPKLGPNMVLTFFGIPTTYAGQMLSLDSMLPFDRIDPVYSNIFNVGYFVLPAFGPAPNFLTPILATNELILYRTDHSSYAQFGSVRWGRIDAAGLAASQYLLYAENFKWLRDGDAAAGKFIRWNFPDRRPQVGVPGPGGPDSGKVTAEKFSSQRIDLTVDCREDATLIFKLTFHPNWHVTIDGIERAPFMVSPSYLAVAVPAGHHEVRAEYRSSKLKKMLLIFGALILLATTLFRNRLRLIEDFSMFHV